VSLFPIGLAESLRLSEKLEHSRIVGKYAHGPAPIFLSGSVHSLGAQLSHLLFKSRNPLLERCICHGHTFQAWFPKERSLQA